MERSGDSNDGVRHRGSKRPMTDEIQPQQIDTPTRNISRLAISAIVIGVLFGVLILYNLSGEQRALFDLYQQKESHHQPGTQLKEGAKFLIAFHKTPEKLLLIADQVIRDSNNSIAVIRQLFEEGPATVTVSRSRLIIPKSLPKEVNTSDWQIDGAHVAPGHIGIMLSTAYALGALNSSKGPVQVLTVGLGGGSVNVFLRNTYENVNVTAVEIDPAVIEVAKKYFGFVEDERQHCVVNDGIHFLNDCDRKGKKFDVIILDVCKNTESFVECPVKTFVGSRVTQQMARALSEDGILLINQLTIGDGAVSPDTIDKALKESAMWCEHFDVPDMINKVLACVKRYDWYKYMQSNVFHEELLEYYNTIA